MFERSLTLGNIFGFRLQAHWSLIIIFLLIAAHLGFGVLPQWHPEWSIPVVATVAIVASVVFFASIALHELAHAIAARGYGLDVSSITLFMFGGVSNLETEPESPGSEAVIAIVGPITSVVLGVIMLAAAALMVPNLDELASDPEALVSSIGPLATILMWAGPINILLAAFNMLPAFPMDGGRVLRAAMWRGFGDLERATEAAAIVSRAFSWAFVAIGLLMAFGVSVPFFGSGLVGGLWIAVIGWFIGNAARATMMMQRFSQALEGVKVGEVASRDVALVDASSSIQEVVSAYLGGHAGERLLVGDGDDVVGVVGIDDVRSVPRERWSETPISSVMQSRREVDALDADADALSGLRELNKRGQPELPVVDEEGRIRGVLRLDDIVRWIRVYGRTPA